MSSVYSRLQLYFKNLYVDYSEVFKEVRHNARKRPLRASLYGAATLLVLNMFRTNEGLRSYTSEVVAACNKVGSVTEGCRRPRSSKFVGKIGELNCHGLLRQVDLGFSTLIYRTDTNPETALYRYNCSYLRPSVKDFFQERIVDLSVLGHWLFLEFNMKDYDINEEHFYEAALGSLLEAFSDRDEAVTSLTNFESLRRPYFIPADSTRDERP